MDRCRFRLALTGSVFLLGALAPAYPQGYGQHYADHQADGSYGPYAGSFLADGRGLAKPLDPAWAALKSTAAWTLSAWFNPADSSASTSLIAGIGDPLREDSRYLALVDGHAAIRFGVDNQIVGAAGAVSPGWHLLAAVSDGATVQLYLDGAPVGSGQPMLGPVAPTLELAPDFLSSQEAAYRWDQLHLPPTIPEKLAKWHHFGGRIAELTFSPRAYPSDQIKSMAAARPDFNAVHFEDGSKHWPYQTRQEVGYLAPQDPASLPRSRAPFPAPVAKPAPEAGPALVADQPGHWTLAHGWRLAAASTLTPGLVAVGAADKPEQLSRSGYDTAQWYQATVPGTILTTLIDRGVYPDSDFGLNNMAIPETLNREDYWYRLEFPTPEAAAGSRLKLTFNGINYAAEVWLNGERLGTVTGAFIRGTFDVTERLKPGATNALAVRISPPPHSGIPHEQSIMAGSGDNGGEMLLDGPTFVATEGWDWIPGIRDRNSGLWQDVTLTATRGLALGDAHVVTTLPLPDTSSADVEVEVPVHNAGSQPVEATVKASFEGVELAKKVTAAPGDTMVTLAPSEFRQLHLTHPRLWWPNGYGKPELYHLELSVTADDTISDRKQLHFGVREITYELSLYDQAGHLRRVEVSPTVARARHEQVMDVSHLGMRQQPLGWASTLTAAADNTPAVRPVADEPTLRDLVLKINGVRIAARGGNWGMDDSRKRVSRAHLEPFFKLQQLANVDIIRNWVGQNTEQSFYDLADEYGMMVWNDFWESTQDDNAESQDAALWLANARDTVSRFRNHPSIVVWCGRNEGVPQPILNEGLAAIFAELDGTRYYSPSSNQLNLRNSGPYQYQDPKRYFDTLNRGFSVELGIPSFSTIESFQHSIAPADQWPLSDAWAYHDWHQDGNGDVAPFVREMDEEFGAATSLPDFERKAQMLNYTLHRAIFEGFNQHLWQPNSGRMLWMTQPAWPSNMWQILSSDYDTQASFYGVKKSAEPRHIQLDLSNYDVAVINTTLEPLKAAQAEAEVYSLANEKLLTKTVPVEVAADQMATAYRLDLRPLLEAQRLVFVRLRLLAAKGQEISTNFYWLSADGDGMRKLNTLAPADLAVKTTTSPAGSETRVTATVTNHGKQAAIAIKLTPLRTSDGERVLPAYLSDNYLSLLPGESRVVTIDYPSAGNPGIKLGVRGYNLASSTLAVP